MRSDATISLAPSSAPVVHRGAAVTPPTTRRNHKRPRPKQKKTKLPPMRMPFYTVLVVCVMVLWISMGIVTLEYLPTTSFETSRVSDTSNNYYNGNPLLRIVDSVDLNTLANDRHRHPDCLPVSRKPHFSVSLGNPLPSSPYHVFHTITTRFMVGQPRQPILARARYLLFETFCWPTVKYQSTQNFYWLVLVDPRLDPSIISDIQDLLTSTLNENGSSNIHFPAQNAFLVLTDNAMWAADGVGVPNVTSYGAGLQEVAREYRDGNVQITTGNTYHLMNALEIMEGRKKVNKPLLMIETLLDADDGLNNQGIKWIQDIAIEQSNKLRANSKSIRESPTLNTTWFVLCGTDHIEWHNRDIFRFTDREYETFGLTSGITGMRHAPLYCASAGYTRAGFTTPLRISVDNSVSNEVTLSDSKTLLFPQKAYSNHALAVSFPACNETQLTECLRREFPGKAYILKSRSITSDSMDHMNPKRTDYRDNNWENKSEHILWVNETEKTWNILRDEFSINRIEAWHVSVYLRENAHEIVKENQNSHCAPGFPCREVTQSTFKKLDMHLRMMDRKNEREKKAIQPLP